VTSSANHVRLVAK